MKKIFCFIITFCLIFTFSGCKKEDNNKINSVDIEYYAKLGQIAECEYALGDNLNDIEENFKQKSIEDEDFYYDIIEGKNNRLITDGIYNYYCKMDDENQSVAYIISYDTAYGFKIGDISIEIKEALSDYDVKEEKISEDNAFFYFGDTTDSSVLICEFGDNTVMFVIQNNALCATAIYSNILWK